VRRAAVRAAWLALALPLLLAGCASLFKPTPPARDVTADDTAFEVNGRFAVRFGTDGGSGRIAWTHSPRGDEMTIANPLGIGLARIVRRDGIYTLTTTDNREHSSADPDQLTRPVLGWSLPLSGLPFWLRGRAVPGLPIERSHSEQERLVELEQAGWSIEFLSRHLDNGLPERLRIRRKELDIRLVLEAWTTMP
jgi:outer membrane lipoprotein LolB